MNHSIYLLKQAWAGLSAKKGFLATVVTTLGTTIGALLCILTLAYVVISKPLPYPEQDKLYQVNALSYNVKEQLVAQSHYYPSMVHLYKNQTVFESSALVHYGQEVISSQASQPTINSLAVTPGWFSMLDAEMALGRGFEQTEVIDSFNPVAVLTYQTWQSEFAGDASILDQTITINGVNFRVVGVLAESFVEPQLYATGFSSDVILPFDYNTIQIPRRELWGRIDGGLRYVGKLDSDMSNAQVEQQLGTLVHTTWTEKVAHIAYFKGDTIRIQLRSLKDVILGDSKDTVLLLLAGVLGLVLVACANITNLFMSRTAEQQRELAIQAAVGASKRHLFQSLFAQSGLVVLISVLLALVIASIGFEILQQYLASNFPRVEELSINVVTFGSALLIALLLGLFFARLSANMINYRALNATLQSSGKGTGIQVSQKVRKLLVVSQVTIVTLLVFINMGLLKDSLKVINQPLGFETDNVSYVTLRINGTSELSTEEKQSLMIEVQNQLKALPQVEDVANATTPFNDARIVINEIVATEERIDMKTKTIDNRYFQILGQPLVEGDYFTEADVRDQTKNVIINDVYANKIAPEGSALGAKIHMFGHLYTVTGVVESVTLPGYGETPMRAFATATYDWPNFVVQLKPGQTLSRELAAQTISNVNSQFVLIRLETLNERKGILLFTQYTTAITSAVLAILTFFLATIGLYGILNYATQMRRFELGTRLAIGAKRKDIIGLIIKDNAGSVAVGIILSVFIMLALYIGFSDALVAYVNSQLVSLFIGTLTLIALMALFACYWPLRPIINRTPIRSLRGSQ